MNQEIVKLRWSCYILSKILAAPEKDLTFDEIGAYLGGFSRDCVRQWVKGLVIPTGHSLIKIKQRFPEDDLDWIFKEELL